MTLFGLHGRKILGKNPQERCAMHSQLGSGHFLQQQLSAGSPRTLLELSQSSARALPELSQSSPRTPPEFRSKREWARNPSRNFRRILAIFRPWMTKSVISPHPYPILNIFSAVSPIKIFGPDSKLAFFCNKLWNLKLVKKKWHF